MRGGEEPRSRLHHLLGAVELGLRGVELVDAAEGQACATGEEGEREKERESESAREAKRER